MASYEGVIVNERLRQDLLLVRTFRPGPRIGVNEKSRNL